MAWIELHQTLPAHRKIKKLKRLLKIKTPQAVGHVVMLWLWSIDNAPNGDLSQVDAEDIAEACEWPKSAEEFVAAMKEAALIDNDMHLHDWYEYAGRLIEQRDDRRKKDRERQARHRAKKAEAENADAKKSVTHDNVTRDTGVSHADVTPLPDLTKPNHTEQDPKGRGIQNLEEQDTPARPRSVEEVAEYARSIGSTVPAQGWWDYYQARGWRVGTGTMQDWKAAFRSSQNWERWKQRCAQPGNYQPTAERIQENADWLTKFLAEQDAQSGGNSPSDGQEERT